MYGGKRGSRQCAPGHQTTPATTPKTGAGKDARGADPMPLERKKERGRERERYGTQPNQHTTPNTGAGKEARGFGPKPLERYGKKGMERDQSIPGGNTATESCGESSLLSCPRGSKLPLLRGGGGGGGGGGRDGVGSRKNATSTIRH